MEDHGNTRQLHTMSPGHHLMQGTVLVFLAEALLPLTGLVTAAFLTRRLGAGFYGLLILSATLISWIELAISSLFARATVKLVGDAEDWRPMGTAVLRLHVFVSLSAMLGCWALAKPIAALLGEPKLAVYLLIYAVDLPIFALANCHRSLLIGRGKYTERAAISAGRWIARLVLVIVLVESGLSLTGAILANIGASLVELVIARRFIRPSWSKPATPPTYIWDYAVPIFLASIILRLLGLGLFMLKMLGATAAQAGIYGAAQNVSFVMPGVFAVSLSPLLLSTISRVLREGNLAVARTLVRNAFRLVTAMLPLAVIAAAASSEIAILLFGVHFADAGPLIAILIFAGLAMMMLNLISSTLVSCGKPSWTLWLAAPLLPTAIAGHLLAIPRYGAIGAASVSVAIMALGCLASVIVLQKAIRIELPVATFLRALLLSGMTYSLVHFWPTHGLGIVVKVAVAVVFTLAGYIGLGELTLHEIHFFRSIVRQALSGNLAFGSRSGE